MSRRTRGPRTILAAALATAVAAAGLLGVPADADDATAAAGVFHPQLVKVSTPTSGDKATLQLLGLDLTEHAGHDYVEVVLHSPAELRALVDKRFEYDVVIPDLVARGVEIAELNEEYAAAVARSPLPSGRTGYRTLRRLQRRHDRAAEAPAVTGQEVRAQAAEPRRSHHLRRRDRPGTSGGPTTGADVRADGRPPREGVALGRAGHGVRGRPRQELRQEQADHPAAEAGPRHRGPGRQRRRLRPLPHRWRVLRPARAATRTTRPAAPAPSPRLRAAPTCGRTAGSSTARTPPTAAVRPCSRRPPGSAPGST